MSVSVSFASLNPHTEATSAIRWSYFWKIAAIVTAVALTALAAFAVGWTALFLEAHLPLVTIMALFSIPPSYQIFSSLWNKGKADAKEARIAVKVAAQWDTLTDTKLNGELAKYKIAPNPQDLALYKRAFAAFLYNGEKVKKTITKMNNMKDLDVTSSKEIELLVKGKTKKIKPCDYTLGKIDVHKQDELDTYKALVGVRSNIILHEYNLVHSKLRQAHLLHYMQNPEDKKHLSDYVKTNWNAVFFSHPSLYLVNEVGKRFGEKIFDIALTTKGEHPKNYSIEDLKSKDIQALTNEIFNGGKV